MSYGDELEVNGMAWDGPERRKPASAGCAGGRCEDVIRLDEQVKRIMKLAEAVQKNHEQVTALTLEQKETNKHLEEICVRLNKGDETINKVKDFDWFIGKANTVRDYAVWILLAGVVLGAYACAAGWKAVVGFVKSWVS